MKHHSSEKNVPAHRSLLQAGIEVGAWILSGVFFVSFGWMVLNILETALG